jgi:hypothetical protein
MYISIRMYNFKKLDLRKNRSLAEVITRASNIVQGNV